MTKQRSIVVLICSALAFAIIAPNLISANAADEKKPAAKKGKAAKEKAPAKKTTRKKARGRLPAQYGKLNLSTEQRDKIYAVQAKYRSEFQELQKKFAELRKKQDGEIQAVLTDDQKKELDSLLEEAKKARANRSKKTTSKKTTDKKQTDKKPSKSKQ